MADELTEYKRRVYYRLIAKIALIEVETSYGLAFLVQDLDLAEARHYWSLPRSERPEPRDHIG